ncbi:MAG: sigma-70 family RNA polymerase sigma factor [Phyllobacterium sp.]
MVVDTETSLLHVLTLHYDELVRHLTRKLGNAVVATDVAQDTYLRLQSVPAGIDIQSPRAFIFRVADNLAIDHLRKEASRARYFTTEQIPERAMDAPLQDRVLDYRQRLALLEQAIAELPPKCRETFLMHKYDGLSHAEIARELHISRSMVEKHIMKALAHCRDRLSSVLD